MLSLVQCARKTVKGASARGGRYRLSQANKMLRTARGEWSTAEDESR
jgi:hypothetical protein